MVRKDRRSKIKNFLSSCPLASIPILSFANVRDLITDEEGWRERERDDEGAGGDDCDVGVYRETRFIYQG